VTVAVGAHVRIYAAANPDNYGEVGMVVETYWAEDPEDETRIAPWVRVQMPSGDEETCLVRETRAVQ
jgi:hypothetical protein